MNHTRRITRLFAVLLCVLLATAACGSSSPVETGTADGAAPDLLHVTVEAPDDRPLQAILEHVNTNPTELGDGWTTTDEWYTEGEHTQWTSECPAFDRLGDMFNNGAPLTRVWERGTARAVTRTADFNWGAFEFAYDVERIPEACPAFALWSEDIQVTAVDESVFSAASALIAESDPFGVIVAIKFDAYPLPSRETDVSLPEFDFGEETWVVLATRHNVVSQLVYTPGEEGTSDLQSLVDAQAASLVEAEVERRDVFEAPAPPEELAAEGTVPNVSLIMNQMCRDDGTIEAEGLVWVLDEPIPQQWEGWSSISGDLVMEGTEATFTSHAEDDRPDVFSVTLTTGLTELSCLLWD